METAENRFLEDRGGVIPGMAEGRFRQIVNMAVVAMLAVAVLEVFLVSAMGHTISANFPPMFAGLLILAALIVGGAVLLRSRHGDSQTTAYALRRLDIAAWSMIVLAAVTIFVFVPTEVQMGMVQRIFYFHVGAAWVGSFGFLVTLIAGIIVLRTRSRWWDTVALSSVEIGLAFITMVLITGSIWARPIWNTWWTWDPRLTTASIMWLVYLAYLMLRGSIEDPERRMRFAAVYGIIGFVSVIATFLSIQVLRDIHPAVILGSSSDLAKGNFNMEPTMLHTLLLSLAAFTMLYFALLLHRMRLEQFRDAVEQVKIRLLGA